MINIIDLTQTIEEGMPVYPGDDLPRLQPSRKLEKDHYNDDRLEISMHTGTHVDGPMHLMASVLYISDLPMNSFIGEGCLLDVRGQPIINSYTEYHTLIPENSIVLMYTGFAKFYGQKRYYQEHPIVSEAMCQLLIEKKIKLLGMDSPSPDRFPFPIHKLLFAKGIYIVENLTNLDQVPVKTGFELTVLPLKIKANSAPARVIARF